MHSIFRTRARPHVRPSHQHISDLRHISGLTSVLAPSSGKVAPVCTLEQPWPARPGLPGVPGPVVTIGCAHRLVPPRWSHTPELPHQLILQLLHLLLSTPRLFEENKNKKRNKKRVSSSSKQTYQIDFLIRILLEVVELGVAGCPDLLETGGGHTPRHLGLEEPGQ